MRSKKQCCNYDRYCDHMEIDQIVMQLSFMETHKFQAYDPTTRRIDKQRSEWNQALRSCMQAQMNTFNIKNQEAET